MKVNEYILKQAVILAEEIVTEIKGLSERRLRTKELEALVTALETAWRLVPEATQTRPKATKAAK